MARPHVPEFGAWDDGLTYTAVFDEARAAKGGKMINPNDPAENPDLAAILYGKPASAPPPPQGSDEPHGRNMANVKDHEQDEAAGALHVTRPRHARRASRENLKVRRSSADAQVMARPGVGDPTAVEEDTEIFNQHKKEEKMREAVRNRTSSASPARNGNKSHKLGTSFQKDMCSHCTIL